MSLEQNINRIATALEVIAERLKAAPVEQVVAQTPAPAPVAPPSPATPAPAPAPTPAPAAAPTFANQMELNKYTIEAYKELGPEKGLKIGGIMTNLGAHAITDLTPDKYVAFREAVEALKAS